MRRIHLACLALAAGAGSGTLWASAAVDPAADMPPSQSTGLAPAEHGATAASSSANSGSGPATLADILEASGLTATGYVAASYYRSSGNSTYHEFDIEHDTFQLDQAGVIVAYQPKQGFGALLDLIAGEDARVVNTAENGSDSVCDVLQAYVQYAQGALTVIAGKFLTLAGAETVNPTANTNFSRSLLNFAEPISHTGVRATYAVTDTLNAIVGIDNGWNTTSTSYGSKTGEFGLAYAPSRMFAWTAQAYVGKEPSYDALRTLFDTIATYNATASLAFSLNYSYGRQEQRNLAGDLQWNVIAAYVNYAFSEQWRVSVRGEYLDDADGFVTGTAQQVEEGTVTLGYIPQKQFELRIEARYDTANEPTFQSRSADVAAFSEHQSGFAVQGIFKF